MSPNSPPVRDKSTFFIKRARRIIVRSTQSLLGATSSIDSEPHARLGAGDDLKYGPGFNECEVECRGTTIFWNV